MKVFSAALCIASVHAYTSNNGVMTPGNENFPSESGFQKMEVEQNLPVVNVKYRFPAADAAAYLKSAEDKLSFDRRVAEIMDAVKQDEYLMKSSFLQGAGETILQAEGSAKPSTMGQTFDSGILADLGAAPAHHHSAQAAATETLGSCPRDYSAACPAGFSSSGGKCVASSYQGPCAGEAHDFSNFSLGAKKRFSSQCGAFWPCSASFRSCSTSRSYSGCPEGFTANGSKCVATAAYDGPCSQAEFTGFNANMMKLWSEKCGAYFPCA